METNQQQIPVAPEQSQENTTAWALKCRRCPRRGQLDKDGYCWLCGPIARSEAIPPVICPACKALWHALTDSGVCIDCSSAKDKARSEQKRIEFGLNELLGGPDAAEMYKFSKIFLVNGAPATPVSAGFAGNVTAYKIMRDFNPKFHGAYLWGPPGAGKTHMAMAAAAQAFRGGARVVIATPRQLVGRFHKKDSAEAEREMRFMVNQDMIVINELGVSKFTDFAIEIICELMDRRSWVGRRGIVVTGNLSLDGLAQKYSDDRITSRIAGACYIVEVDPGRDFRIESRP